MPENYAALQQQRTALLDQMAALDRMERGRLSEQFLHGLKEGRKVTWGPYYVLQRRLGRIQDQTPPHSHFVVCKNRSNQIRRLAERRAGGRIAVHF